MKKLFILILLGFLTILPSQVKAETLFGFQDGKYYDSDQNLKYLCFMDDNCYDLNGKFGFKRVTPLGATPTTTFTLAIVPNQFFPREVSDGVLPTNAAGVSCNTSTITNALQLNCRNASNSDIQVKGVLFTYPVAFDGDFATVNNKVSLFNADDSQISFTSSSTNTTFVGTLAKIIYSPLSPISVPKTNSLTQLSASYSIKVVGGFPSLVLVGIDGHDVIYKVN